MAESTLSLTFTQLATEVGRHMGFGRAATGDADVVAIVSRGLRQFYQAYEWSFLKPWTTLTTQASYGTGTMTNVSTTFTITGGTIPSDVESNPSKWVLIANGSGDDYLTIASADVSEDTLETDSAPTSDVTAASFTLHHNAIYTLPDNFGGIDGPLTFARLETDGDSQGNIIKLVDEGQIRARWNADRFETGTPRLAAVRVSDSLPSGTTNAPGDGDDLIGQRYEILLWPEADNTYTIEYQFIIQAPAISDTSEMPLGGMQHAETIMASCLAVAEEYSMDRNTNYHAQRFELALQRSIARDQRAATAETMGYNSDRSDRASGYRLPRRYSFLYDNVTYNNVEY